MSGESPKTPSIHPVRLQYAASPGPSVSKGPAIQGWSCLQLMKDGLPERRLCDIVEELIGSMARHSPSIPAERP